MEGNKILRRPGPAKKGKKKEGGRRGQTGSFSILFAVRGGMGFGPVSVCGGGGEGEGEVGITFL